MSSCESRGMYWSEEEIHGIGKGSVFCEEGWTQTHVYEVFRAQKVNRGSQTTVCMYMS